MLALAQHRDLSCPGCGGWLPDTTSAEAEDKHRFEVVRCHRCTGQSMAVDKTREMYRPESLLLREVQRGR
jgi:hypothetical protein